MRITAKVKFSTKEEEKDFLNIITHEKSRKSILVKKL